MSVTWLYEDFVDEKLEISRSLFVDKSLADRKPRPKQLEVYALVSGISFEKAFMHNLVEARDELINIIDHTLAYWVEQKISVLSIVCLSGRMMIGTKKTFPLLWMLLPGYDCLHLSLPYRASR